MGDSNTLFESLKEKEELLAESEQNNEGLLMQVAAK